MNGTKKWYESKTFWFNVIVLVIGVAVIFGFSDYVPSLKDQEQIDAIVALVAAGVPVVNLVLRFLTDTKLTK